jgi:hypothetical protein
MKIRKEPIDYIPIHITLETAQEADVLWHYLNKASVKSWTEYRQEQHLPGTYADTIQILFELLDDHYRPPNRRIRGN